MQTIGWLSLGRPTPIRIANLTAFRQGLNQTGYVEGRNLAIEFRHGGGRYEVLPGLAADLVRRQVAVIVTAAGPQLRALPRPRPRRSLSFLRARAIRSMTGSSRVSTGPARTPRASICSMWRWGPGRLETLRELVPSARLVGFLMHPSSPTNDMQVSDIENAARALGMQLHMLNASNPDEINAAFTNLAASRAGALLMGSDPLFQVHRDQIIELATRYRIPAMYEWSEFVKAGGLISYSTDRTEMWRQLGIYVTRILNGAKPGDLPVMQPTKFELVINLKTAKALGLSVPTSMQLLADEVIE